MSNNDNQTFWNKHKEFFSSLVSGSWDKYKKEELKKK